MMAADMIQKGLVPFGYLEVDPTSKRGERRRKLKEALS
jgi:hypothetical protein